MDGTLYLEFIMAPLKLDGLIQTCFTLIPFEFLLPGYSKEDKEH